MLSRPCVKLFCVVDIYRSMSYNNSQFSCQGDDEEQ
jgi:hypothetical protein